MKKIILGITILIFICACSKSSLQKIDLKSLNSKLDNKETFILYLSDESDGKILQDTLEKVSKKNNLLSYYINTIKLSDSDLKSLKEKFTFDETNIILFIKDGNEKTILSRISDLYISEKDLEQEIKNQGYID